MIYGGSQHSTYLGCLSCSAYDVDSVLNRRGRHGSSDRSRSIYNRLGEYGSATSIFSACNAHATDPPVIVDGEGNYYGRLTINADHPQATQSSRWRAWINSVCSDD